MSIDKPQPSRSKIIVLNLRISLKLRRLHQKYLKLNSSNISIAQRAVFSTLNNNGTQSIGDISNYIGRAKSSTTQLLQRMARKGLTERVKKPNDRNIYYKLTDEAQKKISLNYNHFFANGITKMFTEEELSTLLKLEQKFDEALDKLMEMTDKEIKNELGDDIFAGY
ncbi:MAG: hypothetical protein A9183_07370 [Dehalococcoides mccartyi]|uniref:MarR family winged helix-turn-helix transcriptional regulator n=1 Tax=Dehalococcoides mccartyi TaxID=61435 RepID=UPI000804EAE9|nr:MarR family transcriptional regulator [Dehalococcoides mccartyi]OBW62538.1 MAG: hypothetical protein A9183_07370 [Dehalococcoides mccartyi]